MVFEAQVVTVLIASPGDTFEARNTVEQAVHAWNRDRARGSKVLLLPLRWETDAVPEMGTDAQAAINKQLVDEADIVIGLFHSRLGQPTVRGASGTAEEIERSHERGAKVHIYFSEQPHPNDVDTKELERLQEFRTTLEERGLVGSYASSEDLAAKLRTALERDIEELTSIADGSETVSTVMSAILRVRYESEREPETDTRGRVRYRTRRQRLTVENIGEGAAENVFMEVEPVGEGATPSVHFDFPIERIAPKAFVNVPVSVHMGVANQWRIRLLWTENGQETEDVLAVTPY